MNAIDSGYSAFDSGPRRSTTLAETRVEPAYQAYKRAQESGLTKSEVETLRRAWKQAESDYVDAELERKASLKQFRATTR